ncbi:hypothetical protein [Pseudophaeobacter sp. A-200-2]|uniref:hypothetical protein n=1 Tax=Pseudophaeobacter sp. A-200-2 TaxID=3098145 RepID=UPI0034D4A907
MGVAIGIMFTCGLGWLFDANFAEEVKERYTYLASAVLSLLVASFAVAGVFSSIASQRGEDHDDRKRRLLAARAKLPLALSAISKLCKAGICYSAEFDTLCAAKGKEAMRDETVGALTLDQSTVHDIIHVIENLDNLLIAERLSAMLREYQIFFSRWVGEFDEFAWPMIVEDADKRSRTVSWAYLGAICGSLYDFARKDGELGEVDEEAIRNALSVNLPVHIHWESFQDEIGMYARVFKQRFG